jgi:hypothetical protein
MSVLPAYLAEAAREVASNDEDSILSLVTEAYEAGRRAAGPENRLPQNIDFLRVMAEITEGRRSVFQISLKAFARVCTTNGLFTHLPPYEITRMEHLWRDELRSAFCGPRWTLNAGKPGGRPRAWRVRCPQDGNFWVEPCRPSR